MTAIDFPVQIALEGAPGSGKQKLVQEFATLADPWFASHKQELRIIENGGTVIERDFDKAMGVVGDWETDIRANFLRYEKEEEAWRDGASFVTLGTPLGNIAHCGVNLEHLMTGFQTPDHQVRMQYQQLGMTTLTYLFQVQFMFRPKFFFYLPLSGSKIIVPGVEDSAEDAYNRRIDGALRVVFGNFGLRPQVLDHPTIEENAAEMFETVRRIVEEGPQQPEEETSEEEVPPVLADTLAE